MALLLTEQSLPGADREMITGSHHNLTIQTINLIAPPSFDQRNLTLQTPEEMMEDVQILSTIGAGAFAVVYRGVYQGGDVAIKLATIEPEKSGWSEAFVACQLRHPHVVSTYTARGARLSKEFFDSVWNSPATPFKPPAPPEDALPALPSEDGLGCPRKATHEQQGWKAVLARVGASPNKGLLMLVQERCDRGSLTFAIKSGVFRTTDKNLRGQLLARRMLLRTATEVCRGMVHLHRASVVHGDLKPANVLLHSSNADRRGFVAKIADFGLARVLEKDVTAIQSETTGTLPYMSPEAFNGVHSKAGDVYAFGILLFEMLTGVQPYESVPPGRIMMGVSFHGLRPPWPLAEWPELCGLGARCLEKEPAKRPTFKQLEGELVALEEAVRESSRRESMDAQRDGGQPRRSFAVEDGSSGAAHPPLLPAASFTAGGGSRSASPSPPASPRPRHRLAASGGFAAAGSGGGGAGPAASPVQRSSLELRRAVAAVSAASAAATSGAGGTRLPPLPPLDAAAASSAAAAAVAGTGSATDAAAASSDEASAAALAAASAASSSSASEPVSPWATAFATAQAAGMGVDGEAAT